jgi:hypothetical protein
MEELRSVGPDMVPGKAAPEVWTGHATNRALWLAAAAGAACVALGVELAVDWHWGPGLAPLVMSVVGCVAAGLLVFLGTMAFTRVRVRIDRETLEVRCGYVGVPCRRIPLTEVDSARFAPLISPCGWGGWGYRWRPKMGTAVVVRRGQGFVVDLGGGHRLTVTVDDAEGAVRAITDRLRTSAGPHSES